MRANPNGPLFKAQNGICPLCGHRMLRFPMKRKYVNSPWSLTIDHVLARSLGGYDGAGNVVITHRHCNNTKKSRLPTGCEMIWLLAVCERLNCPVRLKPDTAWRPPQVRRVAA